jgi:hypothetical protein
MVAPVVRVRIPSRLDDWTFGGSSGSAWLWTGLLELEHNADHLRSQLVRLTELGRAKYAAIDR